MPTIIQHNLLQGKLILSGKDGQDAKPYQEKDVIPFPKSNNTLTKAGEYFIEEW